MKQIVNKIGFGIALVAAAMLIAAPSPASAQKKKRDSGVIRLEETVIEGRVAKPNAFFINTRQAMVYNSLDIRESFVKEISKAVKDGPF